jgi:hypothetical protein
MTVWDLIGDYMPGDKWSEPIRHLLPPDDNGDKEWTLAMEEVWRSPGFADLCDHMREHGWSQLPPVKVGQGKVLDGNRCLVAAMRIGEIDSVPVVDADAAGA